VKYRMDGALEYIGRVDNQVKIRGHRIELGEIEAVLKSHVSVSDAVVTTRQSKNGEARLLAYFVSHPEQAAPSIDELRTTLRAMLPEYMIPSSFIKVSKFQLTPNGKIDRHALPDEVPVPEGLKRDIVVPRTELELQLVKSFEQVLGRHPVSVTANFFDCGGDSLDAVRLVTAIGKTLGTSLALSTVFEAPTPEQLAAVLARGGSAIKSSPLIPIQTAGSLPPLFWIHSGRHLHHAVAELLGPEQPFYALWQRGFDGKEVPHARIEDMASDYIQAIRKVRPEGPYRL